MGHRHALVTDGNIKIAVHADLKTRHDMVIEHVRLAGGHAEVSEELLAFVGLAVAVGVAKDGQIRHVHHVERAVVPDHSEHGIQLVCKDDRILTLAPFGKDENPVPGLIGGPNLIHRVFGDEECAAGCRRDLTRVLHGRHRRDEPDLEPLGHLRQSVREHWTGKAKRDRGEPIERPA